MNRHLRFLENTLDAVPDEVVVISEDGRIQYANEAWAEYGRHNGARIQDWRGVNYLGECERAGQGGDPNALRAREAIRAVLREDRPASYMDYPCHGPDKREWYRMVVTPFYSGDQRYGIILHRRVCEENAPAASADTSEYDGGHMAASTGHGGRSWPIDATPY